MTADASQLINGYLDDALTTDQQAEFRDWLKADLANANQFALAVMLHNRIEVHYLSQQAVQEQLTLARRPANPRLTWRVWGGVAAAVCALSLILVQLLLVPVQSHPTQSAEAFSVLQNLIAKSHQPADRTYRITFVNKDPESVSGSSLQRTKEGELNNEKMLYVRNGRSFVCTWKSHDGRQFVNGSNDNESWSVRPGEGLVTDRPLHFIGGLPTSDYLVPVLNLKDNQDRFLNSFYHLDLRPISDTRKLLIAAKKPDTRDGPRRIEIDFAIATNQVVEMRIYPVTLDHRRVSYTKIELVSENQLDANWFTPQPHNHQVRNPVADAASTAD